MKERSIIFRAEMIRAILEGRKTQTRRVIKSSWSRCLDLENPEDRQKAIEQCPYGHPSDRLWVRETLCAADDQYQSLSYAYKADGKAVLPQKSWDKLSTEVIPSIFMPRWASRITLEIVNIRVERLQDTKTTDIMAEGIYPDEHYLGSANRYRHAFEDLWDSINEKRGYSWESNPWVWVIEFKRIEE